MVCRVYLVRHGETMWNAESRYQGHTDVPLSDRGREQARRLSRRLAGQRYHAVYASSLVRAAETAEIIAAPHGLEVVRVAALKEINFGAWEGLTREEIVRIFGPLYDEWWRRPLTTRLPEGESYADVVARSWGALRDIVRRHAGQQVLVVSHGGVIRALVGYILGMDLNQFWRLRQDNGALNILEFYDVDRGVLVLFNDCSHLEDCRTPAPAWVR